MTDGPLPGDGSMLVLEQTAAQRALADGAFKSQTKAHLDEQDDTLAEHGRKLDAILASDAWEAEQRQELLEPMPRAHCRQPHLSPRELTVAGRAAVRGQRQRPRTGAGEHDALAEPGGRAAENLPRSHRGDPRSARTRRDGRRRGHRPMDARAHVLALPD